MRYYGLGNWWTFNEFKLLPPRPNYILHTLGSPIYSICLIFPANYFWEWAVCVGDLLINSATGELNEFFWKERGRGGSINANKNCLRVKLEKRRGVKTRARESEKNLNSTVSTCTILKLQDNYFTFLKKIELRTNAVFLCIPDGLALEEYIFRYPFSPHPETRIEFNSSINVSSLFPQRIWRLDWLICTRVSQFFVVDRGQMYQSFFFQ